MCSSHHCRICAGLFTLVHTFKNVLYILEIWNWMLYNAKSAAGFCTPSTSLCSAQTLRISSSHYRRICAGLFTVVHTFKNVLYSKCGIRCCTMQKALLASAPPQRVCAALKLSACAHLTIAEFVQAYSRPYTPWNAIYTRNVRYRLYHSKSAAGFCTPSTSLCSTQTLSMCSSHYRRIRAGLFTAVHNPKDDPYSIYTL
jgi:hypothetical protein